MKRILFLCVLWALPVLAADPAPGTVRLRDHNGDGSVSSSKASASLVDGVMKQADTNGDGTISRAEAKALNTEANEQNKKKMRQILLDFDKIDTNHAGKITRPELVRYVNTDPGLKSFVEDTTVKSASPSKNKDPGDTVTDVGYRFKF
ncbi:MAG: hypothetical protein ACOYMV_02215 [Verrucomicrobiia bacterium]